VKILHTTNLEQFLKVTILKKVNLEVICQKVTYDGRSPKMTAHSAHNHTLSHRCIIKSILIYDLHPVPIPSEIPNI
jgi:hypothetical protein